MDTSTVILLPRLASSMLPKEPAMASITVAELCVGRVTAADPVTARRRAAEAEFALARFPTLAFDVQEAQAYASVVESLRRVGRKAAARTTDALIAAVALAHGLPLYTGDPADFAGIDGLDVVAVPHPDRN